MRRGMARAAVMCAVAGAAVACGALVASPDRDTSTADAGSAEAGDAADRVDGAADGAAASCDPRASRVGYAATFAGVAGGSSSPAIGVAAVAPDSTGGVWLTGVAGTGVTFGGSTVQGAVVAHLAGDGGALAAEGFPADVPAEDGGYAEGQAIAVAPTDAYFSILYNPSITIDGKPFAKDGGVGNESVVVRNSVKKQVRHFSGPAATLAFAVAPASGEGIVAVGDWSGHIAIDDGVGGSIYSADSADPQIFAARLFPGGGTSESAVTSSASGGRRHAGGAATDTAHDVYVTGWFQGQMPFDAAKTSPDQDAFVVSLDASLAPRWSVQIGGAGAQEGHAIAAVPSGGAVVVGDFDTAIHEANVEVKSRGDRDVFVGRIGGDGSVLWVKTFGGLAGEYGRSIAFDALCERIVIAGETSSSDLDFGGGSIAGAGKRRFLVAFDADGAYLAHWSTDAIDGIPAVAADTAGRIYWAGSFAGSFPFQGASISTAAPRALFVVRLDPPP